MSTQGFPLFRIITYRNPDAAAAAAEVCVHCAPTTASPVEISKAAGAEIKQRAPRTHCGRADGTILFMCAQVYARVHAKMKLFYGE